MYVAEPWETAEPWDDSSRQQGLDEETHPSYLQQQEWGTGSTAAAAAAEADLLASEEWLLDDEDDDEEEDDEQQEDEDGWLLDEPDSSQASLQQQQRGTQKPAPWKQQTSPQQQPQQQQQRPQPTAAAHTDLQASWEAALAVSLDVLASYDVRYDVDRPARLSSSAAALRRAPGRGWQQPGEAGLGPEEVSLTTAAVAAARDGRRGKGRRQQVGERGC